MKPTLGLFLISILMSAPAALGQQSRGRSPAPGRVATRTHLVALYSDLEKQLATAAQNQDQAKLDQLLDADFERWGPEPPGDPLPREDWKAAYRPTFFNMRQIAVRAFSDTDVVSFVAHQKGMFGDREINGEYFIVDVWRRDGNTAKLAARYVSRVIAEAHAQPASPPKH